MLVGTSFTVNKRRGVTWEVATPEMPRAQLVLLPPVHLSPKVQRISLQQTRKITEFSLVFPATKNSHPTSRGDRGATNGFENSVYSVMISTAGWESVL